MNRSDFSRKQYFRGARNDDGSQICSQTVAEIFQQRREMEGLFPYLSDLLGSDWGSQALPGEGFWQTAYRVAREIYPDEPGFLTVRIGGRWM